MTARDAAERAVTLDANILGRDYKIACKEHERAELAEAVTYLDKQMREIRDHGKVTGADRIAVMAALNIAHDLLRARREGGPGANAAGDRAKPADAAVAIDATSAQRRIRDMGTAIDQLLAGQEKLF
ncbi:MAG TPA: cell division protein ZapA [Gemmatimonadaceae bacterium]